MTYFQNISSLADLKKKYRRLAIDNHPDKGGSTETMQRINSEFEKLFAVWKDVPVSPTSDLNGYENDYGGASAGEYARYVYNEYRWRGSNYHGQSSREIVEIIRSWLKETYPKYKFSVRRDRYSSIDVTLMSADFEAFTKESGYIHHSVNHYWIENEKGLTDRAREVMTNVKDFVMSYNYDNSDPMTDYFCTNFYLTLGIGKWSTPYKVVLPKLGMKGPKPKTFRHPEGAAHRAIRQALGKGRFDFIESRRHSGYKVYGADHYGSKGEHYFWPKQYSSAKLAQKRIDKLEKAGIICTLTGYNGGCIRFIGYTTETERMLRQEEQEYNEAREKWELENGPLCPASA